MTEDYELRENNMADRRQLFVEMRAQDLDSIRLSTYRTACKLRFVQKRCNLHLVDIWNVIEAFRESGLNHTEANAELPVQRLHVVLSTIFFQLNKRMPTTHQINAEQSVSTLLSFLLTAYDALEKQSLSVLVVRTSVSSLCGGKLLDKLRYVFSQISDATGMMVYPQFDQFLKEVLRLPMAVFEGPSFGYSEQTARTCFTQQKNVSLNSFLDVLMSDPPPQCLVWLSLMHRLANVENVFHPIECSYCQVESMMGFRYRCQRCNSYQLCQDCFWRGHANGSHSNQHQMKEYTSWKSPSKKLSQALSKSLSCASSREPLHPLFPDPPDKPLTLTHIVDTWPPRPVTLCSDYALSHSMPSTGNPYSSKQNNQAEQRKTLASHLLRGKGLNYNLDVADRLADEHVLIGLYVSLLQKRPQTCLVESRNHQDEEHSLIARYAARLAAEAAARQHSGPSELPACLDANKQQRELIAELENKNREILQEIQLLRLQHEEASQPLAGREQQSPVLLAELRLLRQRKEELEQRMCALQESRRELMVQLEQLMTLLKSQSPASPRSSPSLGSLRPIPNPIPSSGTTPTYTPQDSLTGVGGDVLEAFAQGPRRNLRNDLLIAADSITHTMSSLVRELNSEGGSETESTVDSEVGRCDVLTTNSSDPFSYYTLRSASATEAESFEADLEQRLEDGLSLEQLLKPRPDEDDAALVTLRE